MDREEPTEVQQVKVRGPAPAPVGTDLLESSSVEKDLVDNRLSMSHQFDLVTKKANGILGFIASSLRNVILPLQSALLRLHVECYVHLWTDIPVHAPDMELLEQVQRAAITMIKGLEHLSYEERLNKLGLFSLKKRQPRGDLFDVCR
ncbi:hypothetical protein WISP_116264 [Willisornis vidua]|uniref:Uncharacterized protein n=1 Tax=Willisornis vidua TaxID=1566151 RepID=A0ABQ9CZV7_9PASS|nr:hypothetical protein WISP_116264 [Willisornis vidua]